MLALQPTVLYFFDFLLDTIYIINIKLIIFFLYKIFIKFKMDSFNSIYLKDLKVDNKPLATEISTEVKSKLDFLKSKFM